eukprot:scaffold5808_cov128-Isochrysis_galbana.AAC.26
MGKNGKGKGECPDGMGLRCPAESPLAATAARITATVPRFRQPQRHRRASPNTGCLRDPVPGLYRVTGIGTGTDGPRVFGKLFGDRPTHQIITLGTHTERAHHHSMSKLKCLRRRAGRVQVDASHRRSSPGTGLARLTG